MLSFNKYAQAEKTVKGRWIFKKGTMTWVNDPNQQLGQACHKISDIMAPGAAINRVSHEDEPAPPPDLEFDRRQVQH